MKLKFPKIKVSELKFLRLPRWGIILIVVLGILGLAFIFRSLFVAALVNGRPVFRVQVISELEKQSGKTALDSLVSNQLILQEAFKKNIVIPTADVDNEVTRVEGLLKEQGTNLQDALTSQGLTMADWRDQIKIQMMLEKLLADKLTVTDAEIQDYFTKNKDVFDKNAKLADVKDQIIGQLKQQKLRDAYMIWIQDLKSKAKINYFINY
ncbi:SurA N-terminal domain-containing protein [Patescibacteria group bacterium]|nr:SurA N-terminal domain-containing protein [Patescibacteria group bacterium]